MIEAMACGTPVLAFRCGSVTEVVEDRLTGAIVHTMEEAIQALPHVMALDRQKVRRRFEQRFSATRMAMDYITVYRSLSELSRAASANRAGATDHNVSRRPVTNGSNPNIQLSPV